MNETERSGGVSVILPKSPVGSRHGLRCCTQCDAGCSLRGHGVRKVTEHLVPRNKYRCTCVPTYRAQCHGRD